MTPLYWFRKPAAAPPGPLPPTCPGTVWLRLTVNGKRTDLSTAIRCTYGEWNAATQRLRGHADRVRLANARLTTLLDQANAHYYALDRAGLPVTPDRLKQLMQHGDTPADEPLTVAFAAFAAHQQRRYLAREIRTATANLPGLRLPHVTAWLAHLRRPGLLTRELTPSLVREFRLWLLSPAVPRVTSTGYANKVAALLGEVAGYALERGAILAHPCPRLKLPKPKQRRLCYLTPAHVAALAALPLAPALARTRDGFLFQCATGLAWADARALRPEHISEPDRHGQCWLRLPRQKTGCTALIPVLPAAAELLARYAPKPPPVCANQLYNARLKVLGQQIGLDFALTSHIGRKTFAMNAAESGVSIDAIAAMLGHANAKYTHLYAKLTETRVRLEMAAAGLL